MATPPRSRVQPPGAVHTRRVALLMLVGLAALTMPFPWVGVALLPLGWAAAESVRAVRAQRQANVPGAAQAWTVSGLVLIVVLIAAVGWPFLLFGQSMDYQQCLDGANTGAARAACRTGLIDMLAPAGVPFPLGR